MSFQTSDNDKEFLGVKRDTGIYYSRLASPDAIEFSGLHRGLLTDFRIFYVLCRELGRYQIVLKVYILVSFCQPVVLPTYEVCKMSRMKRKIKKKPQNFSSFKIVLRLKSKPFLSVSYFRLNFYPFLFVSAKSPCLPSTFILL